MIDYWFIWGMGFLLLPRFTIGLIVYAYFPHNIIGVGLMVIGGVIDIVGKIRIGD